MQDEITQNSENISEGRQRSLANLKPFKRGQSGNPGGRPKKIERLIDYKLDKKVPGDKQSRTYAEALVDAAVEPALKKSDVLMKEIFERVDGAVGEDRSPININVSAIPRYRKLEE